MYKYGSFQKFTWLRVFPSKLYLVIKSTQNLTHYRLIVRQYQDDSTVSDSRRIIDNNECNNIRQSGGSGRRSPVPLTPEGRIRAS